MFGVGRIGRIGRIGGNKRLGGAAVPVIAFPAPGARYDIDWTQTNGGNILTYASAPTPADSGVFATQPDAVAYSSGAWFFRQRQGPFTLTNVERADGSLRRLASGVNRSTDRGLLCEPAVPATVTGQPILWTSNLTNAAWVKSAMTAALNQTSRSAIVNSATLLTATAPLATILYPVTLASSSRNLYADIKRITGTGNVEMTADGGATWTVITLDKPRFDGWGRYGLPLSTITNPSFGFRLSDSGDQIAVAFVQSTSLAYDTSPVDQTGSAVGRNYDRPSTSIQGGTTTPVSSGLMDFLASGAPYGILMEWDTLKDTGFIFGELISIEAGGVIVSRVVNASSTKLTTAPGVLRLTTDQRNRLTNRALLFVDPGTTIGRLSANGGAVITGTGFGAYTTLDHNDIGSNGSGGANIAGFIRRTIIFSTPPTDAQMQAWTTVA